MALTAMPPYRRPPGRPSDDTTAEFFAAGNTGTRAYGYSDSVTVDDRWHISEITKSMTATLAAVLATRA